MANLTGAFGLFKPSKEAVMRNSTAFLAIIFLPGFLSLLGEILGGSANAPKFGKFAAEASATFNTGHPLILISLLLTILLVPAGIYLEVLAAKGKTVTVMQALSDSMKYFWRIIGLGLLVGLIVIAGLIFFIVPGIIFIRRYFLAPYFLVDQDLGILKAMEASAAATKGKFGAVWGIIGVMMLFSLFSFVTRFGGFVALVLTTLYSCAPALRYFELKKS